ncbi:MAG: SpoIIE family protein phosphatase [Bacilli bacterium]|nr:SpoIIE family protein phosphatase [Bacilli bacterium]
MKFRFPILAKIAILGTLTSVIAAGISVTVSYFNQVSRSEKNQIDSIDSTLESIRYSYEVSSESDGNRSALASVVQVAADYYADPEVRNAELSDFPTFFEYEAFMRKKAIWFYPPADAMIGSMDFIEFRNSLAVLQSSLVISEYSCGAMSCFLAYYDEDTSSYVFVADSRTDRVMKGVFYYLTASHYKLKDSDILIDSEKTSRYDTYLINKLRTKFLTVNDDDGKEIGTFFIQYNTLAIERENKRILATDIAILSSTSVAIIAIIVLASYLMFTRNIRKLTKSAEAISAKLSSTETFEAVEVNIKSNDELKTLGNAIVDMEDHIVNYVDIIKNEASEREKVAAELSVASKIQKEALPATSFIDSKVAVEAYIVPAKEVGGDFYDYFYVGDNLVIVISDVSGKGVPAALFMMRGKELIKSKLNSGLSLTDAIKEVNDSLCSNNEENLFITSFIGVIDFEKGEISYVSAGHEKPYILSKGEVIKLDSGISNFVLGGMEEMEYVSDTVSFEKGDRIFLFTDGLNEAINKGREEFGYDRIVSALNESKDLGLREILDHIEENQKKFVGKMEAFDDTTMMIVENLSEDFHLFFKKKDYSIIEEAVDAFQSHFKDLSDGVKGKVGIILDELLNNLVSYEQREDLEIEVSAKTSGSELTLVISSNGADYDILKEHKEKYATGSEEIEEGGFGITIVKDLAKEVTYGYKKGRSIVTVILDLNESL